MKFKIVSDSSSNIFAFPGVSFASVALKINTANAEYVDDENLDVAMMVRQLQENKGKSGTSCPNVHDWLQAFDGADRVFAITITSNLSGSYASARQAKAIYEENNPGAKVYVVDSLSTGPEMRLIMERIREWIDEKLSFEQIKEKIQEYQKRTHLLFSLESLTNLARNGRVNPAVAKIAGVLGIRMVGCASEVGTLQLLHKCRGEKKALETMFKEMVTRGFEGGRARIAHCFNPEAAASLKETILAAFPKCDIFIEPATALCSFYAEQGGLLVGFESK